MVDGVAAKFLVGPIELLSCTASWLNKHHKHSSHVVCILCSCLFGWRDSSNQAASEAYFICNE